VSQSSPATPSSVLRGPLILISEKCFDGDVEQYGQPNCWTTGVVCVGGPRELLLRLIAVPAEHDNVINVDKCQMHYYYRLYTDFNRLTS